jgi:hypothetical protein
MERAEGKARSQRWGCGEEGTDLLSTLTDKASVRTKSFYRVTQGYSVKN